MNQGENNMLLETDDSNIIKHLTKQIVDKAMESASNWDGMQQAAQMYQAERQKVHDLELELAKVRAEVAVLREADQEGSELVASAE